MPTWGTHPVAPPSSVPSSQQSLRSQDFRFKYSMARGGQIRVRTHLQATVCLWDLPLFPSQEPGARFPQPCPACYGLLLILLWFCWTQLSTVPFPDTWNQMTVSPSKSL